jgi:serine/threonine-protein kinase
MISTGDLLSGRYRLDTPLAEGGFAVVYRATDLTLGREVAVKVLHAHLAGGDRDFAARFATEARTAAALAHPNILAVHDFGQQDNASYLVMPLVTGGSLSDRLGDGPLSPAWAAHYLRQAAAALDHAHRRGLVHRDVKPANMLLDEGHEHLFLADFGIARALEGTSIKASMIVGTVTYMAPEQIEGRVTRATDIYALGCVAVELLTGLPPYSGGLHQVMHGHLALPVPDLAERGNNPALAAFQPAVERALAKSPEARYASAGDFSRALDAAIADSAAAIRDVAAPSPAPASPAVDPRERALTDRYARATMAADGGHWSEAAALFAEIVTIDPEYRDARAGLREARRQSVLDRLISDARDLTRAQNWPGVLDALQRLRSLDPDFPDPEGLEAAARAALDAARRPRQAMPRPPSRPVYATDAPSSQTSPQLDALYERACEHFRDGEWVAAVRGFEQLALTAPGYRDADELLNRARELAGHRRDTVILPADPAAFQSRGDADTGQGTWSGITVLAWVVIGLIVSTLVSLSLYYFGILPVH